MASILFYTLILGLLFGFFGAHAVFTPEEALEIATLKQQDMEDTGNDKFEVFWNRVQDMLDYEHVPVRDIAETWNDILTEDVVYVWHRKGKCNGLQQVYACFKHEQGIKSEANSNVRSQHSRLETVKNGAVQSVRLDISIYRRGANKKEDISELFWLHFEPETKRISMIQRWTFVE